MVHIFMLQQKKKKKKEKKKTTTTATDVLPSGTSRDEYILGLQSPVAVDSGYTQQYTFSFFRVPLKIIFFACGITVTVVVNGHGDSN